jgi:membrane fusion protein (multidrug efflux system)
MSTASAERRELDRTDPVKEVRVAGVAQAADGAEARPVTGAREAAAPKKGPPVGLIVLAVVVLALGGFGVNRYMYGLTHVSTDNAQVEGYVVPVLSRVTGYVTEIHAVENQSVHSGDVLVVLDDRDFKAKLAQSEADLAAARATAGGKGTSGQAEAQVAAAQAAVAQAQANDDRAHADLERYRTLAPRGVISKQQLDAAEAAALADDAQLDASKKQVEAAKAALLGADAKLGAAMASRDQSALNLSYTQITAPISGVVSRKTIELGQLVQAGQPTMSVVPLDDVWVVANLKETEVRDVTPGDKAEIEVDSYPGRKFTGTVESLSPATGAKFSLLPPDNATGNFTKVVQRIPVRIKLDSTGDAAHPLRPGMSVTATVITK